MDVGTVIYKVLSLLFLPPGLGVSLVFIFGVATFFTAKHSKFRNVVSWLFVLSLALSYALTTRTVGYQLAYLIEGEDLRALPIAKLQEMQSKADGPGAIVILGGGLRHDGRETPHSLNLNQRSAVRAQHGAYLAKNTGLPVLVSGGIGTGFQASEALVLARTLNDDFGIAVRWLEDKSMTTAENALFSASILKAAGIKKIVLVTQAYHMRRSVLVFEAQGLEVVMAPCGFLGGFEVDTHLAWLPALGGIEATFVASHEIVGLVYYWFKGYIPSFAYGYHKAP
jgi:uncharacterized SAM-binding protein YcdF (DUF218 family)